MRTVRRVLVAVILAAWGWSVAEAQEEGPTLLVEAGFDGYCWQESWCPVRVVILNEETNIEGELRIVSSDTIGSSGQPDVYARHIVLPAHSRRAYFLYIPPETRGSQLSVYLVVDHQTLASQQVSLRYVGEEYRLYGIVSSAPSALNFLSNISPISGGAATPHLSLESLPPDPLGWEGLDTLVLNDVDTGALSTSQRRALRTWVSHGGHLIIGGGTGAPQTAAGVSDLLPVTVAGVSTLNTLESLGEYLDAAVAAGPYPVARASLVEGEAVIHQDGLILMARRKVGAGTVDFIAFDAGVNPFARWEHNVDLWTSIVEAKVTSRARITIHDTHYAHQAVGAIPRLNPPSALQILGFLLAYVILIGPVNYVVLNRLDRRDLAWLTIPLIILGFTVGAYAAGLQIRGREPVTHQLAAVRVPEETTVGRVSELVGVFSPRRARYDVRVEGASARRMSDAGPLTILQETGASTMMNVIVDVGGIRSFLAEGYVETVPPQADLRLTVDSQSTVCVQGTVQNGPIRLEDAALIVGANRYALGDLESGQTVADVGDLAPTPLSTPSPGDRQEYRRHQFLQAVLPSDGLVLEPGAYLIGWGPETPFGVELAGTSSRASETVLYIFDLPVAPLTEEAVSIPSSLIVRELEQARGHVDVVENRIVISAGASSVFRFSVWPEAMVSSIGQLTLHVESIGYSPAIAMWDWRSQAWEPQDVGWGSHAIPQPDRYVHPSGIIRIRTTASQGEYVELQRLAITIEGRR